MVSSAIDLPLEELLRTLGRIKREHAQDAEYRRLRTELPKSWPM